MNAERLLQHYERIADAPDAIARLRRFILDLAVRGKLVPQNANDEPVLDYLIKLGEVPSKARKQLNPLAPADCGGDLPASWSWLPLGALVRAMDAGWSPQCENHPRSNNDEWGVLKTTAIQALAFDAMQHKLLPAKLKPRPEFQAEVGDILVTRAGPKNRVGVSCVVDVPCPKLMISDKLIRFHAVGNLSPSYIALTLNAGHTFEQIEAAKSGMAVMQMNISQEKLRAVPVPLPPLAEQHRIVAKVDELMGLCDRLEAARAGREETRDRLTAASLARLNAPDPETFQNDARFALDALPALTTRPDQIKRLRQTILNLAVRGKLVPQDAKDEPASELLKRIAKEKGRTRHPVVAISLDDEPYPLPEMWKWTALDQLIVSGPQNGISPKSTNREDAPKAITLTATTSGSFNPAYFKHVEASIPRDSEFWLSDGDLLFQRGNTREYVGMAAVYRGPAHAFLFPDLIMKVRVSAHVCLEFAHLASISPPAREFLSANASGAQATMPKINQTTLVSLPIPLPPLAEQHRIVAKVDALMALCDRLEASLTATAATRRRLLDALLAEALAPVDAREMEAAE